MHCATNTLTLFAFNIFCSHIFVIIFMEWTYLTIFITHFDEFSEITLFEFPAILNNTCCVII